MYTNMQEHLNLNYIVEWIENPSAAVVEQRHNIPLRSVKSIMPNI
jgi:hypothetical protein